MSRLAAALLETARVAIPRLVGAPLADRQAAQATLLAFVAAPSPTQYLASHRTLVRLAHAAALHRLQAGPTQARHERAVEDFLALQQSWDLDATTLRALPAWRGSAEALTLLRQLGLALTITEAKVADQLRRARAPRAGDGDRRASPRSIVITKSPSSATPAASAPVESPTRQAQPPRMSTPGPGGGVTAASSATTRRSSTRKRSAAGAAMSDGVAVPPKHDETWVSRVSSQEVGVAHDGVDSAPGLPVEPISDSLG